MTAVMMVASLASSRVVETAVIMVAMKVAMMVARWAEMRDCWSGD